MISKLKQYGMPRNQEIKAIVIHNTRSKMSARELFDYLENKCKSSKGCHFLVDHKETIEVMPLDYVAWNTGGSYDYGNMHGIAIEVCSNVDTKKYLKGEIRAVKLIKKLMKDYNLTKNDIYFHCDFNKGYNCPSQILQIYKNKKNFIDKYF